MEKVYDKCKKESLNMKRYCFGLLLTSALGAASCSDSWLDLNPSTSVTTEQALSTMDDIRTALNGAYRQTSVHSYYGDNYWYYGDCRAMDVQAREGKGSGRRVSPYYEYNAEATDNFNIVLPWQRPYVVIRQANNIISHIDAGTVADGNPDELDAVRAEALALRGLALFNLTRLFGMPYTYDGGASPGVPIVTEPTGPESLPARNTVGECYAQVVKDFTDALPALSREKRDGYVNYWAAQALLSRIYLDMGEYQKAYDAATDVIENNGGLYSLYSQADYPGVWGQDFQSESLFELYITLTEPSGGTGGEGAPMVYANESSTDWNNLILTEDFLNLLDEDADDVRHCITQPSLIENNAALPDAARNREVFLGKFPGKSGNPQDNNICIIRLSEVYLNAAEAGAHLGGAALTEARGYLNQLVSNRTTNTSMQVSSDAGLTVDRVLRECRKELVGEGQIFFIFLRNKKTIERKGGWHLNTLASSKAEVIEPTDLRIALPVPQAEIDANPNIVQNAR